MKTRRKILIILDILFLIVHLFWFVMSFKVVGIDLSKPFYLFMAENYLLSLMYAPIRMDVLAIIELALLVINLYIFVKMFQTKQKDDSFPTIATYVSFFGLAYFSILIGVLSNVLMS